MDSGVNKKWRLEGKLWGFTGALSSPVFTETQPTDRQALRAIETLDQES